MRNKNSHYPERTTSRVDKMSGEENYKIGRFGKKFQNRKRRQLLNHNKEDKI